MNTPISAAQIHQQLIQDMQSCEALLVLLSEEREAMRERNMDDLERILTAKAEHLQSLENSADARTQIAEQYSSSSKPNQQKEIWQDLITQFKDDKITESWRKLKSLLSSCKLENEVNGKLLARNHQIYSRLLELVRGQPKAPSLYNSTGSSTSGGSSHIVGEA